MFDVVSKVYLNILRLCGQHMATIVLSLYFHLLFGFWQLVAFKYLNIGGM